MMANGDRYIIRRESQHRGIGPSWFKGYGFGFPTFARREDALSYARYHDALQEADDLGSREQYIVEVR